MNRYVVRVNDCITARRRWLRGAVRYAKRRLKQGAHTVEIDNRDGNVVWRGDKQL